ncbi:MAG: hypothetical protein QOF83_4309 [Solirubrobacteraceae bacterium]|nr:hypothetical protein [Solirubrobacteraceae bacterium]
MADRQACSRGVRSAAVVVAAVAALTVPAAAQAAPLPTVATGQAHQVTYGSAVLAGAVNPNGSNTSNNFQYGLPKAYGGQTTIADAGGGTHTVKVSLAIGGLQPLTVYHYRLVAVNGSGAAMGKDQTFLTTKVPLSLAILASPNPVLYGGTVTVQGTLSGTENANRAVALQANAFPFTAGFQNFGNPELTTATGSFSFPVLGMAAATQFRVVTTGSKPVLSPVASENVAVRVSSHIGHVRRRHFARFYGTVTPAEDGAQVAILRITHGHGVLVSGTVLRHASATSSTFSRVVPVRSGVYRVLVRVINGAQVSNYGQPLVIR